MNTYAIDKTLSGYKKKTIYNGNYYMLSYTKKIKGIIKNIELIQQNGKLYILDAYISFVNKKTFRHLCDIELFDENLIEAFSELLCNFKSLEKLNIEVLQK